jgi:methylenetetrahydrofolate dehydrogenase (NADP+)/methenyltetrahydrofolate cyclohydrolase
MPANILSGKPIADVIRAETESQIMALRFKPCLAAVRVGNDPASEVYVKNKVKTAVEMGIISDHRHLDASVSQDELLALVDELNSDDNVDGILVQLPLPAHINERAIVEAISPEKDVDGFHPTNVGRLSMGYASLVPCTPAGVIEILRRSNIDIAGKSAVIVGRSNIVGKPLAMLLLKENATVTICHSRTKDLASITGQADVLIAAIGRAGFIRAEHIREGSTVIDVGINRVTDKSIASEMFDGDELIKRLSIIDTRGSTLVGDVNHNEAMLKAANFTPVPGGVGLLTIAMLMKNTVAAAIDRRNT